MKKTLLEIFHERDNLKMYGTLYTNSTTQADTLDTVALFFNAGNDPRHVYSQLFKSLASVFDEQNIPLAYFDFPGTGESAGKIKPIPTRLLYTNIEKGAFVPHVKQIVNYFREAYHTRKFIFMGICGGAITSLHTAALNECVDRIILLGLPVTLTTTEGNGSIDSYLMLNDIKHFIKDFDFRKNLAKLKKKGLKKTRTMVTIQLYLKNLFRRKQPQQDTMKGLNAEFVNSFHTIKKRGMPVLCLYGEDDMYFLNTYRNLFLKRVPLDNGEPTAQWKTVIIPKTNHHFYELEARENIIREIRTFLSDSKA